MTRRTWTTLIIGTLGVAVGLLYLLANYHAQGQCQTDALFRDTYGCRVTNVHMLIGWSALGVGIAALLATAVLARRRRA